MRSSFPPNAWLYRKLIAEAIDAACELHSITQTELAPKIGVNRVMLTWSKSSAPIPGHDYPKPPIGIERCLTLLRVAGKYFDVQNREDAAWAWYLETAWRSRRMELQLLDMLPPKKFTVARRAIVDHILSHNEAPGSLDLAEGQS